MEDDPVLPRLSVIVTHVLVPAAMFWLASAFVFDATPVIRWLAAYRPSTAQSTLELNVSRQILALDARLRESGGPPIVAIIGSSSVINGVDVDRVNAIWRESGRSLEAVNFGQTGFVAYELALLKKLTLDPKITAAIFLYNSFSFADQLLGTVVGVRWSTEEMLRLQPPDPTNPSDWRRYAAGVLNEWLPIVRYGNVLKSIVLRSLRGELEPNRYFYDFPPEPTTAERRERVAQLPAPESDWLRKAYADSDRRADTTGYQGFERYLQLARERGIKLIVAPVPEPEFSLVTSWRIGTSPAAVDARVAEITARCGVTTWPRSRTAFLEADDSLFRDPTHFNRFGREQYSQLLASWLGEVVP
jgi:hypothetical protein